jgi:hypothetical protein
MRGWLMASLLLAGPVAAQTTVPTPEAEALGKRIAAQGTLAVLLPLLAAKDTEALIAEHPELDDAGKAKLRSVASDTARAASDRLVTATGHQYALRLSLDDLKALAAFAESPAAQRRRAAEPAVIAATAAALDGYDFKKEAWSAYCATPGVTCAKPK